jgi:hypothetical protein
MSNWSKMLKRLRSTLAEPALSISGLITLVIGIALAVYVIAAIMPGALTAISTTTITSAAPGVQTLFSTLIPLLVILAVVLAILGLVRLRGAGGVSM